MNLSPDFLLNGTLWYVAFLFSTTLHEASHALVAKRLGDLTAYEQGHVTLDPIPHMRREPFGTIIVPILSYLMGGWMIGWASVPYNFQWALDYPKRSAKMSLAGPAANLLLVLVTAGIIRGGITAEVFVPPEAVDPMHIVGSADGGAFSTLASFISVFFSLNLLLFIFNLLPIPPLDGSGILTLFLSDDQSRKYLLFIRRPQFSFVGLLVAWKLFGIIYHPFHLAVINLLYTSIAHYG